MQIAKVRLDLVEEPPGTLALRRQQAAAVLEAARSASGDGAQDVEVGDQRLRPRRIRAHRHARCVVGDAEHEQRVGEHQLARGVGPGDIDLIEPPDLSRGEPVRRDRLDEAEAVGFLGARQRHEVLHRGMRDQAPGMHVLLDGVGERAHQTQIGRASCRERV